MKTHILNILAATTILAPASFAGSLDRKPAPTSQNGLPWPMEGHAFTIEELNRYRTSIIGNVVQVKLAATSIRTEVESPTEYRVFIKGVGQATEYDNYAYVFFPVEGAEKMSLLRTTSRPNLSFYVKVEADRLTAVGRSKSIDSFKKTFSYTW